jgi:hypothetical protein
MMKTERNKNISKDSSMVFTAIEVTRVCERIVRRPVGLLILPCRTPMITRPMELARNDSTLMPSRMFNSGLSQGFAFYEQRFESASVIHSFWSKMVSLSRINCSFVYWVSGLISFRSSISANLIIVKFSDSSFIHILLLEDLSLSLIFFIEFDVVLYNMLLNVDFLLIH